MLDNIKYFRYNENEEAKIMLRQFFEASIYHWNHWFPEILWKDPDCVCVGVSDYQHCALPEFYDENEPGYFGKTGVMLLIDYPAAEVDSAIYLTNEEYFSEVSKWAEKYVEDTPEDAEKVAELLEKLKEKFGL